LILRCWLASATVEPVRALLVGERHSGARAALAARLLDRAVYLNDAALIIIGADVEQTVEAPDRRDCLRGVGALRAVTDGCNQGATQATLPRRTLLATSHRLDNQTNSGLPMVGRRSLLLISG
jgi:hypothetical protein